MEVELFGRAQVNGKAVGRDPSRAALASAIEVRDEAVNRVEAARSAVERVKRGLASHDGIGR